MSRKRNRNKKKPKNGHNQVSSGLDMQISETIQQSADEIVQMGIPVKDSSAKADKYTEMRGVKSWRWHHMLGFNWDDIGEEFGVTPITVGLWAKRAENNPYLLYLARHKHPDTDNIIEELINNERPGEDLVDLVKRFPRAKQLFNYKADFPTVMTTVPLGSVVDTYPENYPETCRLAKLRSEKKKVEGKRVHLHNVLWAYFKEVKEHYKVDLIGDIPQKLCNSYVLSYIIRGTRVTVSDTYFKQLRNEFIDHELEKDKPEEEPAEVEPEEELMETESAEEPSETEELAPKQRIETIFDSNDPSYLQWFQTGQQKGYLHHVLSMYKLSIEPHPSQQEIERQLPSTEVEGL